MSIRGSVPRLLAGCVLAGLASVPVSVDVAAQSAPPDFSSTGWLNNGTFNTKTFVDNFRTPHTERLHVVERWKLVEDGKTLEVTFTVDDPGTYGKPWSAMQRYRRADGPMTEQVRAENNFLLFDYGVPVAGKIDF